MAWSGIRVASTLNISRPPVPPVPPNPLPSPIPKDRGEEEKGEQNARRIGMEEQRRKLGGVTRPK